MVRWRLVVCVAGGVGAVLLLLAFMAGLGPHELAGGDFRWEAAASVRALLGGRFSVFLSSAPAYGGSLLLRAPFMFAFADAGSSKGALYLASAVPCLAALAVFAGWAARRVLARGAGFAAAIAAVGVAAWSPAVAAALHDGHPEEILGAALCVAAVLAAQRQRAWIAGSLLGLAVGNKAWALAAVPVVLLSLDRPVDALRAAVSAAGVGAILVAPFLAVGGLGASGRVAQLAQTGSGFAPQQAWWWFGSPTVHGQLPPGWLGTWPHLIIVLLPWPLAVVWRLRGRRGPSSGLLLLSLCLLLRAWLDPFDNAYYGLPFLFALLAWETGRCPRPPVLSALAAFCLYVVFDPSAIELTQGGRASLTAGLAVAGICAMLTAVFEPRLASPGRRTPAMASTPTR